MKVTIQRLNPAKSKTYFLNYIKAFILYPRASGFRSHDQSLSLWSCQFSLSSGFLPYYISSIYSIILSNQLQQQISAKMNTYGLKELEESMAQCNSFKSMKCSCTDYLCCLPAPPMPEPKVDTTNHAINFIPFSLNLQIILYNYKTCITSHFRPSLRTSFTHCNHHSSSVMLLLWRTE